MSDSGGDGTRWLKYGCFGCLGLVVVVLLVVVTLFGIARMSTDDPQIEDRVLSQDLGGSAVPDDPTAARDLPTRAGTVTLDLSQAEFAVLAGEPGEPLRVEASYDTKSYELEETFEGPEGGDWRYTVRFRRRDTGALSFLKQMFSRSSAKVRIFLPPDSPIRLELDVNQGGAEVDLGGLWLTEADIKMAQSGLELEVSAPLREPLERLTVDAGMGGLAIKDLGNASPRELEIEMSMGGMDVDLRGAWRNDAEITILMNRGGGALRLPSDVQVEGLELDRFPSGVEPEVGLPTLRFTSRSNLKDIDVRR